MKRALLVCLLALSLTATAIGCQTDKPEETNTSTDDATIASEAPTADPDTPTVADSETEQDTQELDSTDGTAGDEVTEAPTEDVTDAPTEAPTEEVTEDVNQQNPDYPYSPMI